MITPTVLSWTNEYKLVETHYGSEVRDGFTLCGSDWLHAKTTAHVSALPVSCEKCLRTVAHVKSILEYHAAKDPQ